MFLHILFTCLILLQIEAKKLPNGLFGLKALTFFKKKKKSQLKERKIMQPDVNAFKMNLIKKTKQKKKKPRKKKCDLTRYQL